ncbi:hypothetical protein [uncultured Flavobacterium sp.]|uniref:hypothetical protein n=1 Tax=uncultured Flavobacterium sp. TaxID=165435 RepID=UPI0025954FCA|nr:hypothetical protein [uncultured Flavobacterium sp.]
MKTQSAVKVQVGSTIQWQITCRLKSNKNFQFIVTTKGKLGEIASLYSGDKLLQQIRKTRYAELKKIIEVQKC